MGNDLVLLGRVVDPDALTEEQVRTLSADLYREVVITNFDLNREVAITNFGWIFLGFTKLNPHQEDTTTQEAWSGMAI